MPRRARKQAESGIYHIMLRGIDRQQIFEDPEDYFFFQELLWEFRLRCGYALYAYCLMGNHAHILLRVGHESLESTMKRIAGRYVYWYNVKYQRIGHLFQDRFKSEPVEDNTYFLTVLRYIHQNPVKAGICRNPGDYAYSSYCEYLSESGRVDIGFALEMITREEYVRYHKEKNDDQCLELSQNIRRAVTDEQAREVIFKISRCRTVPEFQELGEAQKIRSIKKIHEKGVSIRQICRLTGISKGMVEKWLK